MFCSLVNHYQVKEQISSNAVEFQECFLVRLLQLGDMVRPAPWKGTHRHKAQAGKGVQWDGRQADDQSTSWAFSQ